MTCNLPFRSFRAGSIRGRVGYAFTDRIFARLEYRYNDFRKKSFSGLDADLDQHIVNIGLGVTF